MLRRSSGRDEGDSYISTQPRGRGMERLVSFFMRAGHTRCKSTANTSKSPSAQPSPSLHGPICTVPAQGPAGCPAPREERLFPHDNHLQREPVLTTSCHMPPTGFHEKRVLTCASPRRLLLVTQEQNPPPWYHSAKGLSPGPGGVEERNTGK